MNLNQTLILYDWAEGNDKLLTWHPRFCVNVILRIGILYELSSAPRLILTVPVEL
jgi:hypothetical protein